MNKFTNLLNINKLKKIFLNKDLEKQSIIIDEFANQNINASDNAIKNIINKIQIIKGDTTIGFDVYRDIEFFENFTKNEKSKTVFDVIDSSSLKGGKIFGQHLMSYPSYDLKLLNERKCMLETFETKLNYDDIHTQLFNTLQSHEQNVMWLFENREKHVEDLLNIVFFKLSCFKKLNNSGSILTSYNIYRIFLSPLIGILSPIIYFIIPWLIITWKFKIPINFITYIKMTFKAMFKSQELMFSNESTYKYITIISYIFSLVFYFQGLFNSVEISKTLYKICKHIIDKFNGIIKYLKTSKIIIDKYWHDDFYNTFLIKTNDLKDTIDENNYINSLTDTNFSVCNNFGKILHGYKFVNKDILKSIMIKTFLIDSLRSIIITKQNYNFTFTNFIDKKEPHIIVKGLRHPCLNHNKVIKNDISLINNNMIITGPNAGGKSTFIKTILINVLLAQTICLSVADECTLTPFKQINSQINIPDCKGYESLFEAEMHRCLSNLNQLKSPDNTGFTFIIMDEIFNSTNPVEGISAAYAVAKKISEYKNCILVFTTHYIYLTKLAKATNKFINYKMNVNINESDIQFPYKLAKGFSKQYIALELLKKNGFDEQIINEALKIKKKLTT